MKENRNSAAPAWIYGLICVGCFVFGQTLAQIFDGFAIFN